MVTGEAAVAEAINAAPENQMNLNTGYADNGAALVATAEATSAASAHFVGALAATEEAAAEASAFPTPSSAAITTATQKKAATK